MSLQSQNSKPLEIFGLKSDLIHPGDDIFLKISAAFQNAGVLPQENDILVIAESALATSENRVVCLSDIEPGAEALEYEKLHQVDAREAELVIRESDVIFGGVFGVLLTLKAGMLCPNAGIDNSNAPDGCVILYPENPTKSAKAIASFILDKFGVRVGVIIADSRTQPLRLGCTGVAIGAAGFHATVDKRGETDLFGRPLTVTRVAVADNLASAAVAVMGESNESTPFALIRNASAVFDPEVSGIITIPPEECMYWGVLQKGKVKPRK
ncbi:Bifunctional F420 biosynthesis protein FbiB [Methanimicrococcus hongohii]|uniref:Bifunctional F420 biosynthesis protein FbiB n=1 Tax=Methanimicrococcus hongohii TaxID=3028295 RepID=A0AA96VCY8_9EURY|nr:coenzyme F420-0:L-glutamate ligase [Methanimicrococcus sp. Hf6]WNY24467.1 Bifunctional F420 biosynthesis protein FbiB [Methanimicrococcus sp. Hf6]